MFLDHCSWFSGNRAHKLGRMQSFRHSHGNCVREKHVIVKAETRAAVYLSLAVHVHFKEANVDLVRAACHLLSEADVILLLLGKLPVITA